MAANADQKHQLNGKSSDFVFGRWLSHPPAGEEVVISGMSGRFPESNNIYEFRDNLFNKKDMVTDDDRRWKLDHPEIPQRSAKIYNIDKFDSGAFGVHYRQANMMDPMMRCLMETVIEAIMDAGVNPSELEGSNTGVFLCTTWSDVANDILTEITEPGKFGITGYLKTFIPHRVSYYLKLKGPSCMLDSACSSSFYALEQAFKSIRTGQCDNALVGSVNLLLHPGTTLQSFRLGVISKDGKCKVFDEDADGYARSEAVGCIFLQKAKDSRRIYAQVISTKGNSDGFKEQGITFPSTNGQTKLMTQIYEETEIDPSDLSYLEVHGTGTKVGDPQEIEAVDCAIGKRRLTPLWVGSVKSCIGHAEPASGICSIVKVLIAFETGRIPPNMHLNKTKKEMKGFEQGRLKVVVETMELDREEALIGVNNFGFGGSNNHAVFRRFGKKTIPGHSNIPKLVCVSGRTVDSVLNIFDDLNKRQLDAGYIGLLHQIFKRNIVNDLYRGYTIISSTGTIKTSSQRITEQRSRLYIIFGKFENCFRFVGRDFLDFPVFKTTMSRIDNILSSENINIINILKSETKSAIDLLGAVAVQVGIVDVLKSLEVNPTAIHGNSVEKLICAYFNDIITLEQTILTTLKIAKQTPETVSKMDFDKVLSHLKKASTTRYDLSFNEDLQGLHKDSSSLINVSRNSVVLNFSDKNLDSINMILPGRNTITFLEAMGSLYEQGYNPQLDKLYPEVNYPVGRGTAMISPLVKWNHDRSWNTYKFSTFTSSSSEQHEYNISLLDDDYKHIAGHVVDGRNLFPAAEYLNLVWQTFLQSRKLLATDLPIIFENCRFIRALTMPKSGFVKLLVTIQQGTGNFEVLEKNSIVVSGRIYSPADLKDYHTDLPNLILNESDPKNVLEQDEIFKEFCLKGYNFCGMFRSIVKYNVEGTAALAKWENNWTTFIDVCFQIKILKLDTRRLYVPTSIKKLTIDPVKHLSIVKSFKKDECLLPVYMNTEINLIKLPGIEICGIQVTELSKRKSPSEEPVLEKYEFVPNDASMNLTRSTRVNTQIVIENSLENNFKAVEIIDEFTKPNVEILMPLINNALQDLPLVNPDLTVSTKTVLEEIPSVKIENLVLTPTSNFLLIVGTKILQRSNVWKLLRSLNKNGFVLTREENDFIPDVREGIEIITEHTTGEEKLILFRSSAQAKPTNYIEVSSQHFQWLPVLQTALQLEQNVLVYSQNQASDGILGLLNCIRREPGGHKVRGFFMVDQAPKFNPEAPFYRDQIKKELAVNIYKKSKWGTYRHLLLDDLPEVESEDCYANVTVNGNLSSLSWIEGPLTSQTPLKRDQVLIHTYYSALNFKDIMLASGRINTDAFTSDRIEEECLLGMEYSGKDPSGRRVAGMISNRGLSTLVIADANLLWPVPETWSLEDAATFPIVYGTVVYGLLMMTTLKPGLSILIHSATGGIGIAALNVALYYDCQIFATVGTQEKRNFLKDQFPQIPDSHIGNSRDTSFEEMIKIETKGRGVDIVLNSLTGEKLVASINCLARGGKFMEIGKFDLVHDVSLNLMLMQKEISYHGVMLDKIFETSPQLKLKLWKRVSDGIRLGFIKPLPRTVFRQNEVEAAFRYMSTGKHMGKVLLKIRDEEEQKIVAPPKKLFKGIPRFYCDSDKSYIIVGGLGEVGLELADWLVLRGAKKLILVSTSGIKTGYPTQRIDNWKKYGVTVFVAKTDVTTKSGCLNLINDSNRFGKVDGIFNLAVVLKDALFENQTEETFCIAFAPKAHVTTFLDQVTREHCPDLRYFVTFSSVSCGRGNAGQTNYGMANSIMERICERRKQDGLPALAIQWGAIGNVGLVVKMQNENKELLICGTLPQKIWSCFEVLDRLLKQHNPIVASTVIAEKQNQNLGSTSAVDRVAQILGIRETSTVSSQTSLAQLGLDSIMVIEVMQILEKDFEIYMTLTEVRNLTFAKLIEIEAEKKNPPDEKN